MTTFFACRQGATENIFRDLQDLHAFAPLLTQNLSHISLTLFWLSCLDFFAISKHSEEVCAKSEAEKISESSPQTLKLRGRAVAK